jgi:hypothetical protein
MQPTTKGEAVMIVNEHYIQLASSRDKGERPSNNPSKLPSNYQTAAPIKQPSSNPNKQPSNYQTAAPIKQPSNNPNKQPSNYQTTAPTK